MVTLSIAPDHFERESQWRTSFNMDPGWRKRKRNVKLKISRKSTAGHPVDHLPRAIQQQYLHVPNFLRRIWPSAWYDHVNSQSGVVFDSISDWSVIMATMQQKESFIKTNAAEGINSKRTGEIGDEWRLLVDWEETGTGESWWRHCWAH